MLPELFRIPGIDMAIYSYGLMLTIGFLVGLWITAHLAEQDGLPKGKVYDLAIYVLPSALLGTRLVTVLTNWKAIAGDWHQASALDLVHSVGHYLGGFLAALLASAIVLRVWRLPWARIADASAPGLALGNVIGRLGCFMAGCCWGKPTSSWIGVRFNEQAHEVNGVPANIALVPMQLIEAVASLAMFALLLWLWKHRTFYGQIILAFVMLYAVERFVAEFWRADPRGEVLNMTTSQFISTFMFPVGLILYYRMGDLTTSKRAVEY